VTLLDTHIWVWAWLEPERLSNTADRVIREGRASGELAIASITLWEVAMLVQRRRLTVFGTIDDWLQHAIDGLSMRVIPICPKVAMVSVGLNEPIAKDPADRLIAATALVHGARLVTADEKLRAALPGLTEW
jgi:PIN domain nuclease of toxin-antitoxin system